MTVICTDGVVMCCQSTVYCSVVQYIAYIYVSYNSQQQWRSQSLKMGGGRCQIFVTAEPGRPLPPWGSGGITSGKILDSQMLVGEF